jgi:F0F1-type ATP synthase assembly protein I
MLLGYLADFWLGTSPWLVVVGIVVGSYSGFLNVWRYLEEMENDDHRR